MVDTLDEIKHKIVSFRDERDWKQFHKPKDLAVSLSIEAAELLELFQWKSDEEIEVLVNSSKKVRIEEEIADITAYLLLLCDSMDINLVQAVNDKIAKNNIKYPIDKCKGKSNKYTEL